MHVELRAQVRELGLHGLDLVRRFRDGRVLLVRGGVAEALEPWKGARVRNEFRLPMYQ